MQVVSVSDPKGRERYVVVDAKGGIIRPVASFLKQLDQQGRARNTLRAYAWGLRFYFEFLASRRLDWRDVTITDLGNFVAWLKVPTASVTPVARRRAVQQRNPETINQYITAITGFYQHHWRVGTLPSNITERLRIPCRAGFGHTAASSTTSEPSLWKGMRCANEPRACDSSCSARGTSNGSWRAA